MRKNFIKVCSLFCCLIFMLTSCGKHGGTKNESSAVKANSTVSEKTSKVEKSSINVTEITDISDSADKLKKDITAKNYENIKWDKDFNFSFPEISQVSTFKSNPYEFSSSEAYSAFDKCFDAFFGDIYNQKDKENLYRFSGMGVKENGGKYPVNLPLCKDYQEKIKSGKSDIDLFVYGNKNGYLEFTKNGLRSVFRGNLAKMDGYDGDTPAMYFATEKHKADDYIKIYNNTDLSKKYKLSDGEISLSDAVKKTEGFLSENLIFSDKNKAFKFKVCDIKPVKMNKDTYGLSMSVTSQYKGVSVDSAEMLQDGSVSNSPSSDNKNYSLLPGNVFILNSEKPESVVGIDNSRTVENEKTFTKIISPENALDIISESVSASMNVNAKSLEFVYTPYKDNEEDETTFFVPCWKLTAFNSTDNLTYCFYVNAVNGEFHYFTM